MSEAEEQAAVVDYLNARGIPFYHVPNEARRSYRLASHLKRMGLRAGVPDLCIPVARGGYHGLYIEMKAGRNKPTEQQLYWQSILSDNGYLATTCWGAEEAIAVLQSYFARHA